MLTIQCKNDFTVYVFLTGWGYHSVTLYKFLGKFMTLIFCFSMLPYFTKRLWFFDFLILIVPDNVINYT